MIPRWFLYLQGFAMLLMGISLLVLRPRRKGDSLYARFVNVGTLWAFVCVATGVALLAMALGYWEWPSAKAPPNAPATTTHHRR